MLALISKTEGKPKIYRESEIEFPLIQVRIKNKKSIGRMLKKLKKLGITRVVTDVAFDDAFIKKIKNNGFCVVCGDELFKILTPRIAVSWLADNNMPTAGLGVEIKNIGNYAYNAVVELKDNIRWLSMQCTEKLKTRIYSEYGISVIDGEIPDALCKTPLKLCFEKENLFEFGSIKGTGAQIILPPPYAEICPNGCINGFARALMENGIISHTEIKIKNVYICNKT